MIALSTENRVSFQEALTSIQAAQGQGTPSFNSDFETLTIRDANDGSEQR